MCLLEATINLFPSNFIKEAPELKMLNFHLCFNKISLVNNSLANTFHDLE